MSIPMANQNGRQSYPEKSSGVVALSRLVVATTVAAMSADATAANDTPLNFTDRYCSSCHNDVDKEGGLDLTTINFNPGERANFLTWVKVHDRVAAGEMPPKGKRRAAAPEQAAFVSEVAQSLTAGERALIAAEGRAKKRRLNRVEYENFLRDLLHAPWLIVQNQLPEDGELHRFNKSSDALDISYVHMVRYMGAAELALGEIMAAELVKTPTTTTRLWAREHFFPGPVTGNGNPDRQKFPVIGLVPQRDIRMLEAPYSVGDTDKKIRELEAMGWLSSHYGAGFGSAWERYGVPVSGRYRLRFSGYTLWAGPYGYTKPLLGTGANRQYVIQAPQWYRANFDLISAGRRNEPIIVYAGGAVANRRIGHFDLTPDPTVTSIDDVWLRANDMIITDAARLYRSRPTHVPGGYTNPLSQRDGQPGVAFRWVEVEGPLYDGASSAGYRLLFGELPLKRVDATQPGLNVDVVVPGPIASRPITYGGGEGRGRTTRQGTARVDVLSANPLLDAERLLRTFLARAYRRAVSEADVALFLGLVHGRLDAGVGFAAAMLAGYTAVLSSPAFVFIDEAPGPLDDIALATRLALFLWNSAPDEHLRTRAERGELRRAGNLAQEVERMLNDPKSGRFVESFLNYWLELRKIEENAPSTTLYNDYYLDDALTEAAVDETRLFFTDLIERNLPVRNIIDSDYTFLNERLALHYGIEGVEGVAMRRTPLPASGVRGGLLTHASVLKVTANGTTTSPVLRGRWIMERILGAELPPPPAAVPAVEPDIRGAVTIRQQLDKHRADESCAVCHRKIDPPGFALESFDVMGGWRGRYRAAGGTDAPAGPAKGFGKNGWPYVFQFGLPVDSAGVLADGRAFSDIRDLKRLLLEDEALVARNMVAQLLVYATGAPVNFGDRQRIAKIVGESQPSGHGLRSLIHGITQSEMFLVK